MLQIVVGDVLSWWLTLLQRDVNDSSTKTGMLFLVDLAGSEMVKKTHATGQVCPRLLCFADRTRSLFTRGLFLPSCFF